MNTHTQLLTALTGAALLAGCGGGGSADTAPVVPPDTSASVSLSGTAAKGLMANADVGVYAVDANGGVASAPMVTKPIEADGKYSLVFTGKQGQPYVVKVSARADGSTTHADEVSGTPQALPAGFAMRALVLPASAGNVTASASITPFSEMAVAAAAKASGGVTAANAAQALSTVTQLLGFNPSAVAAATVATAAGADEQKLAVLLTAVSQMARNGDLGCSGVVAGAKTRCVVDALGASASIDSIKLGSSSNDVSAKLSAALGTVLLDDKVRGKVSLALLTTVTANLACGSSCAAAPVGTPPPGPSAAASAIAAARLLFTEIKSDWSAMFSQGGVSAIATGAVNKEALAFNKAMTGVQQPVTVLAQDLGALLLAADLFNDYKAGRSTDTGRGRAPGIVANDRSADFSNNTAVGCTLYQDSAASVVASAPANANFIGCAARYYLSRSVAAGSTVHTEWRHGFTITPNTDGSFGYQTRARKRIQTCVASGCTITSNIALQTDAAGTALAPFEGKLTPVLSSAGDIASFTLVGELPAAFKNGGITLVNFKHRINVSGTQAVAADRSVSSALSGSLAAFNSDASIESTVAIKPGSLMKQVALPDGSHEPSELALALVWNTGTAEFEGLFNATDSVLDLSKTLRTPTKGMLSGALRNIAGGVTTEFLSGKLTITLTGAAAFDATKPKSASNSYTGALSFVGALTATGRPTLEFSVGLGSVFDSADGHPTDLTLQYRTLVAGKPRQVVSVVASRGGAATGDITSLRLTEASANLGMAWAPGAASIDLTQGTLKVGTLTTSTGLMTFSDGSFMSLDIGL